MRLHGSPWQGAEINFLIWCAVGAMVAWLAGAMMGSKGTVNRVEEVLVGIFGAFIGGEFVASLLRDAKAPDQFTMLALGTATAGAVVMLLLLRLMRRVVGPMQGSKSRQRERR